LLANGKNIPVADPSLPLGTRDAVYGNQPGCLC
jgi:hypothetical protein